MNEERYTQAVLGLYDLQARLRKHPELSRVAHRIRRLTGELAAAADEPQRPTECEWCHRPIQQKRMGRPRRFCGRPCQRCAEYRRTQQEAQ